MGYSLQAFCNYEQDSWVELLPLAEFAYINSIYHSTLMILFWANYNDHSTMQFQPPKESSFRLQVPADWWMAGMEETYRIFQQNIIQAQEQQT